MSVDKLKDAPIVEAFLEIQFQPSVLPEIAVGRLSDLAAWSGAEKVQHPSANLPPMMRAMNPQMQFLPSIEIRGAAGLGVVQVGGNVMLLRFPSPYTRWVEIVPRLETVIDQCFAALPGLRVSRLGLRYVNAFVVGRHFVASVADLAVEVKIGSTGFNGPLNVNYLEKHSELHSVLTRIASVDLLVGAVLPSGTRVVIDIDVFTPNQYIETKCESLKRWLAEGHDIEKRSFRRLIPDQLFEKLKE